MHKVYCQLFDNAVKYDQQGLALVASTTTYANATAFDNEIAAAFNNPTAFLVQKGEHKEPLLENTVGVQM